MKVVGWGEVLGLVRDLAREIPDGERAYGVPRGGAVVAGLLGALGVTIVDRPQDASVIVDDIVDSGMTRERYAREFGKRFVALFEKSPGDGYLVLPWEHRDPATDNADGVVRLLEMLGEDPNRDGLRETPRRYLRAIQEIAGGIDFEPSDVLRTMFEEKSDELVLLRGVRFVSLCEHHLLPFVGQAHVGYLPSDRVVGLSKLARLVAGFARRLQIQERLTNQIAEALMAPPVNARGAGVVIRAAHSCLGCRGAMQPDAEMVTSAMLGLLRDEHPARAEFLRLVEVGR